MSIDYNAFVMYGALIPQKQLQRLLPNPDYKKPHPLFGKSKFDPETGEPVTRYLSMDRHIEDEGDGDVDTYSLADKYHLDYVDLDDVNKAAVGVILASVDAGITAFDKVNANTAGADVRIAKFLAEFGITTPVKTGTFLVSYQS